MEKHLAAITTIIFDIGWTLVDIVTTGRKFGALVRRTGCRPDEAFRRFHSSPEIRRFKTGEIDAREFHRLAAERFGLAGSFEDFAEAWCDLFVPIPGMENLFHRLRERYRVGLLSDTDPLHWEKIRFLFPWLDLASNPTLSFEVGCLKPHPLMYAAALANIGRAPGECLYIDDLMENVEGARESGMKALHFTGPDRLREEFGQLGMF